MILRRRLWALAGALLMALSVSSDAQPPKPTNEFCPIIHDRKAVSEHWSDYNGRRVYFCCDDCKRTFDLDPGAVSLPPPPLKADSAGGHVHGPGYAEWAALVGGGKEGTAAGSGTLALTSDGPDHARPIAIGVVSLALLGFLAARVGRPPARPRSRQTLGMIMLLALWTVPWLLAWRQSHLREQSLEAVVEPLRTRVRSLEGLVEPLQKEHDLNLIHHATFIEYGTPPRPKHSPLGPRLNATYYRGNDERSDRLFNRGNYRTATLHLSVRDEKGERKAGDTLTGPVVIRLLIVRAAFTPDYFFSKPRLAKIYVTADASADAGAKSDPKDRTGLEETQPAQRWQANYRLGPVTASTQGVLYVREQFNEGARFHYAIQYDLQIENGRLGPRSDLFMGSLYRTRALGLDALPPDEWFSHLPIPEKTSEGTSDSKVLGIDADKRPYRR